MRLLHGDYDGGDFVGCAYPCPASFYGDQANHTDLLCSGLCTPGHYCYEATVIPEPCTAGTYNPAQGGTTVAVSCIQCSPGYVAASTGSNACSACPVGFYQDTFGATACVACPTGKAVNYEGSPACYDCAAGQSVHVSAPVEAL